jgi:hypothetical protein
MMSVMGKEGDLDRIDVPEDYEVLDATALGKRLGFKRDTVLAYLSRSNFRRVLGHRSGNSESESWGEG